ncbi:pyroglutamyl-peptidase I [Staphylococcus pasteuri]|uniref:pyroglutamyl-peptidase I n=1 Tax=Staphylococcus pasteuri TaxID=45972 RepID=UPI001187F772|nr:pyroglutamyl-peptidase I [Staphylococcus pasteuri]QDW83538.1 pyroglutamyl-peptidase I [Staphylococcus pasteuri]
MKILVTGFDPFEGNEMNPSWEAVKQLPSQIGEHDITKIEIPTVFHKAIEVIEQKLNSEHYDAVVAIGQAGGRAEITPERIGINIDDARIADNDGNQPIDIPIRKNGAAAYFSNLPVKRMTESIKNNGVPAKLSNTAGTFVCNHILYQLGYLNATQYPNLLFGFIHVPYLPEQITDKPGTPSMSLNTIVQGLTAAIKTIDHLPDLKAALGETH